MTAKAPPESVWVSVSQKRRNEVGMAYTGSEQQPVADLNRDDWHLYEYRLADSIPQNVRDAISFVLRKGFAGEAYEELAGWYDALPPLTQETL